jgi:hypothetical protein
MRTFTVSIEYGHKHLSTASLMDLKCAACGKNLFDNINQTMNHKCAKIHGNHLLNTRYICYRHPDLEEALKKAYPNEVKISIENDGDDPFWNGNRIPSEEQKLNDKGYHWFTYVGCGTNPMPARGPFKTLPEARAAMVRFQERYGHMAGTYLTAGSVHLIATKTRQAARKADISGEGVDYIIVNG